MSTFKRIIGVLLVIVAVVSLVVSIGVTVGVWSLRKPMANAVVTGLQLADDTLASTSNTLTVVDQALVTTGANVDAAQGTFKALASTVSESGPALATASKFLGGSLPDTLTAAQKTMAAAAESAMVVDSALSTLSTLPLIKFPYNPEATLSDSLSGISKSLETLPENMRQLGAAMAGPVDTLPTLSASLDQMGSSIAQIQGSLTSARQATSSFQDLIVRYQAMIRSVQAIVPKAITIVPLVLTFFLFWLAVVQIGALLKGLEWARGEPEPEQVAEDSQQALTRSSATA